MIFFSLNLCLCLFFFLELHGEGGDAVFKVGFDHVIQVIVTAITSSDCTIKASAASSKMKNIFHGGARLRRKWYCGDIGRADRSRWLSRSAILRARELLDDCFGTLGGG